MATATPRERLAEAAVDLERWVAERDWIGTDPYEGLNACRGGPLKRSPLGRRVLIQLVKRSPLDLRGPLGVEPTANPAALAHFLSAYSRPGWLEAQRLDAARTALAARLASLRAKGFEEPCWAYPFDVQSRVFFYPRTVPNTIATAFAGLAHLDLAEATGADDALQTAIGAGEFFLRHVGITPGRGGGFFGYFPGDRTPIHNANLLVCGLLARLARATRRTDFADAASEGVGFALAHQRADGSWPYGERPGLEWVDNFHTGYVLDSLSECRESSDRSEVVAAYDRGLAYYRTKLFEPDGAPRYLPDSLHPIDAQCVAQAVSTFARAQAVKAGAAEMAWRVCDYGLDRMRRPDGAFIFQRRRHWTNRTPHMRWVQAPMLDALTLLLTTGGDGS